MNIRMKQHLPWTQQTFSGFIKNFVEAQKRLSELALDSYDQFTTGEMNVNTQSTSQNTAVCRLTAGGNIVFEFDVFSLRCGDF